MRRTNTTKNRTRRRILYNKKNQKKCRISFPLLLGIIAVVSWGSVVMAWCKSYLSSTAYEKKADTFRNPQQQQSNNLRPKVVESSSSSLANNNDDADLFPDDLQHEAFFETLKSCTDTNNKCKTYIPPGSPVERIAILRPPGALAFVLDTFVAEVVRLHGKQKQKVELIPTSHVPPYGYGKTHGYTKIIRLASLPLRLAATDLVLAEDQQEQLVQVTDVLDATRQLVRWHCRLNHVAAHTSLLTITLEDLIESPWEEEYRVRDFLNLLQNNKTNHFNQDEEHHIDEDELATSMDDIVKKSTLLWNRLQKSSMEDLVDQVVDEELKKTHNLKDWPCISFWEGIQDRTSAKQIARWLSPNCTAPFTSCWVARDVCETQGDAKCVGTKNKKQN